VDRIFKGPFLWPELYRAPAELSIRFLLDEKSTVVPVRLAGEQSGGAQEVPYDAARSNSEPAPARPCLIVVSGQKRWIFFPGIGNPGKASNNDIQVFSFATDRRNRSDFATTLPELYVSMCSNR
jgi:hypothetical protein